MVIRFICPNGHPLSAPEDRAGKPARCPKCQTAFLVPDADDDDGEGPSQEAADGEPAANSPGSSHPAVAATPQASQDIIVFLCPNGHKLNGPASLKGRPGQCPHCKAKFVIPGDDDDDEHEHEHEHGVEREPIEEQPPAAPVTDDQRDAAAPFPAPPSSPSAEAAEADEIPDVADEFADEIELMDDAEVVEEVSGVSVLEQQLPAGNHALQQLLAVFQQHGNSTMTLDLHLKDGQTIHAGKLSPALSQFGFAVCADLQAEETPVVSIVRWEDVCRVTIRGIEQLPPEWS